MNNLSETISIILEVVDHTKGRFKKAATEIKGLGDAGNKAAQGVNKGKKAVDGFGDAADKAAKKTSKAKKEVQGLDGVMASLTGTVSVVTGALATFGLPVVEAATFERKMKEVKAISGATASEFGLMQEKASELGKSTEFSAQQAAEGMKYLAMAGLDAKEAVTALPGALNLAMVGGLQLGEAADYITNVMGGFKLEVSDLDHIVDVLANTSTKANANVQELAEAMSYAAPAAAAAGVSLEATAAAMGILHDNGIKASRAGTNIRGIMSTLAKPTKEGAAALREMGVSIAYLEDGTIDVTETMKRLGDAQMNLGQATAIFNKLNAGAALILANNIDKLKELTAQNQAAQGTAERMAKEFNDSVVGAWRNFVSGIKHAAISIGDKLLPAIEALLKVFTAMAVFVGDFVNKFPNLSKAILLVAAAMTGLAVAATTARTAMLLLNAAMAFSGLPGMISGLRTLMVAMGLATTATTTLGLAMRATLAGAAAYGVVQIGRLIKVLYDWRKASKEVAQAKQELATSTEKLGDRFEEICKSTGIAITSMEELDKAVADGKIHYDDAVGDWVKGAAKKKEATKGVTDAVKDESKYVTQLTADQLKKMETAWKKYVDKVKSLQAEITGETRSLAAELRDMGREGMSDIAAWRDRKKEAQEYFEAAKKAVAEGQAALAAGDQETADTKFAEAKDLAIEAKSAYKDLRGEVKEGDKVLVSSQEALRQAMEGVKQSGELAIDVLKQQKTAAAEAANAINADAGGRFGEMFDEGVEGAKRMDDQVDKLGSNMTDMINTFGTEFAKEMDVIEGRLRNMTSKVYTIKTEIVQTGQKIGGPVQKFATGGMPGFPRRSGQLPGWGGGDKIRSLLEAGEFIVRKEAVKKYGAGFFHALNSMTMNLGNLKAQLGGLVPSVPSLEPIRMQTGGQVPGAGETMTVNFNLPTKGPAIPAVMSKPDAGELLRQLGDMERFKS